MDPMGRGQRSTAAKALAVSLRGQPAERADEPGNLYVARWLAGARHAGFAELPGTHQKALITYLTGQADVWPAGHDRDWYAAECADLRFRYAELDVGEVGEALLAANPGMADSFEEYHRLYLAPQLDRPGRGVPAGSTEVWPVILETDNGDVLQDGVHRFTRYYADGRRRIPALALPDGLLDPII